MQNLRSLLALAPALVCSMAFAQAPTLTINDPAPVLSPEGWVKGTPVAAIAKDKVYVIEFWATWCGPCIAAMPHLSDLADKYQGKATFVSVNSWDRNQPGEKEAKHAGHVTRVQKFVTDNADKMRYNIALDDEKDTIANNWMRAAGRNGIPCAFIVSKGKIAWIGHPMSMDKPLEEIVAGTWDAAAFKTKFDQEAAAAKAAAEAQRLAQTAIAEAAKAGDQAAFEAAIAKLSPNRSVALRNGLSMATAASPAFALKVIEANLGKVQGIGPDAWCSSLMSIAQRSKDDAVKLRAAELSAGCVEKAPPGVLCLVAIYHAQTLVAAGKKPEAMEYVNKAKAAVETFEPAASRKSVGDFVERIAKSLGG